MEANHCKAPPCPMCGKPDSARSGNRGWIPTKKFDGDESKLFGIAAWAHYGSTEPLFGLDRTPVGRPPLKPIPWWRFVRFRRWLCELIAGRDFDVE